MTETVLSGRTINPWLRVETRTLPTGGIINVAMVVAADSAEATKNIVINARHLLREAKEEYTRLEIVARPHILAALAKAHEKRTARAARRVPRG